MLCHAKEKFTVEIMKWWVRLPDNIINSGKILDTKKYSQQYCGTKANQGSL
jgi:hypothetical protein